MADTLLGSPPQAARARILVVEDDANIRTFCQRLLRLTYEVEVAEHGAAALEALRERAFDLVITDLQMPVLGGIELLEQIRQHYAECDALVLTAYATVETAREALKLGALDYIEKPVEAENLQRTVRACLELRRMRQEKERLSDLVFMYQFSQAIATSLDIDTQVEQIVEFLWQRYAPESLALSMLLDEDAQLVLLAARTQAGWEEEGRAEPLGPECAPEELLQAHLRVAGGSGADDEARFAGVVLRSHDRPVGYLHLARRPEQPPFDAGERRLLGIFAGQVAASLDNAQLHQALKDQHRQTIEALAEAIDARDAHTYGHSRQVTRYAVRLAEVAGLPPERVALLDYAGLLHDVGKIGIRDYILLKPGGLSDEEFAIMRRHPQIGVKIIERVRGLRRTLPIIEAHHERWDGKGYPHGLAGEAIPLEARILAIADSFEAMTADRAYRPAMAAEEALAILLRGRGTAWDADLVELFVELIRREGEALKLRGRSPQLPVPLIRPREVLLAKAE
ncbi:MAG TPA: response regulator [Chloroflexaceae bacterium]|nr:response regulator [Chloroflexaceae bacterium]